MQMISRLLGHVLVCAVLTTGMAEASEDTGFDSHKLSDMKATIWTDPNGCQHWIIDDGVEGYMTPRLHRDGRPRCPGRSAAPAPEPQRVTLGADALFDTDKSTLRPSAVIELDAFGTRAKQLGKRRILIIGHTDSRASTVYNQRLSERRARAVADYLEQSHRLIAQIEGRGESSPLASNDTAEGRQANRRVEITVLD